MPDPLAIPDSDLLRSVRQRTPARLLVGRAGASYGTATPLALRADHAAARDAVDAELAAEFLQTHQLERMQTRAASTAEFLLRPDLGRRFSDAARQALRSYPTDCDLQIVIGDGLSARAVEVQLPSVLPRLLAGARERSWSAGPPFAVRYCRVGIMNEIGELLSPRIVVLLIGERPGLATAESLSAYMAYQPKPGDTDARRNLISNIHDRGVGPEEAARRILALAELMMGAQASGVAVKETLPLAALPGRSVP